MIIETIPVGPLETNCYLVADGKGSAVVIDPGDNAGKIVEAIDNMSVRVEKIILTHGHWDHIGALANVAERTGAEVVIHEKDEKAVADPGINLSGLVFDKREGRVDRTVRDRDVIEVGDLKLEILHTPGHTPGSMSVLVDGNLFSGDVIFYDSIGRTDFPGGNQEEMHRSVHGTIMTLPDDTKIFPGHGKSTTVAREREHNPYLTGGW